MDEEVLLVIRRWIQKAEYDLTTARVVLENKPDRQYRVLSCAAMYREGSDGRKTHHLPYLLDQCSAILSGFEEIRQHARALTDYTVEVRYIYDWQDIPEEEARSPLGLAEEALALPPAQG